MKKRIPPVQGGARVTRRKRAPQLPDTTNVCMKRGRPPNKSSTLHSWGAVCDGEGALWERSCVRMSTWARYLRKVHVSFCPFSSVATPAAWLETVSTRKVMAVSPKLSVSKTLLPKASDGAPTTKLTFADGSEEVIQLEDVILRDILDVIDMNNGRIAQAEVERGRPFS